jgi:hypothetical protein
VLNFKGRNRKRQKKRMEEEEEAERDMVTFHLFKPTCNTVLLLLEFLLDQ